MTEDQELKLELLRIAGGDVKRAAEMLPFTGRGGDYVLADDYQRCMDQRDAHFAEIKRAQGIIDKLGMQREAALQTSINADHVAYLIGEHGAAYVAVKIADYHDAIVQFALGERTEPVPPLLDFGQPADEQHPPAESGEIPEGAFDKLAAFMLRPGAIRWEATEDSVCPVHPETGVDVLYSTGYVASGDAIDRDWTIGPDVKMLAYCVIRPVSPNPQQDAGEGPQPGPEETRSEYEQGYDDAIEGVSWAPDEITSEYARGQQDAQRGERRPAQIIDGEPPPILRENVPANAELTVEADGQTYAKTSAETRRVVSSPEPEPGPAFDAAHEDDPDIAIAESAAAAESVSAPAATHPSEDIETPASGFRRLFGVGELA
jgi:hypothetical protein